jgi:hypothetical protein
MAPEFVLHCMPLAAGGLGSVWGLPVVRSGKSRYSALELSRALRPSGVAELPDGTCFGVEELAALGIGPLGRYAGGEPIRPVLLGPEDFFPFGPPRFSLEMDEFPWQARGNAAELFHAHLEFLRRCGFSGGLACERGTSAEPFAAYLRFLFLEAQDASSAKILVLVERAFFEKKLAPLLPEAEPFAACGAGKIAAGGAEGEEITGSERGGILFYEELSPALKNLKVSCDLLILAEPETADPAPACGIRAGIRLGVAEGPFAGSPLRPLFRFPRGTEQYLFRSLIPAGAASRPPALFFRAPKKSAQEFRAPPLFRGSREEAEGLGLLSLWEAGRIEAAGGALFAVNARFSRISAAAFREEQSLFYVPGREKMAFVPPPAWGKALFARMNAEQRDYFFFWREQCRRGNFLPEGAEFYLEVYARELVLGMGKESPLEGFLSLRDLLRAFGSDGRTGAFLFRLAADYAAVYGICAQVLPLLFEDLPARTGDGGPAELLSDLALSRYCIEEGREPSGYPWLIEKLVPDKALLRCGRGQFFEALDAADRKFHSEWGRGFFEFFSPPFSSRSDFAAFTQCPLAGFSSYSVFAPRFSAHGPLLTELEKIALNPGAAALPLGERPFSISLEEELLDELRRESDELRDMLRTENGTEEPGVFMLPAAGGALRGGAPLGGDAENENSFEAGGGAPPRTKFTASALEEFAASLSGAERKALGDFAAGGTIEHLEADALNGAFAGRFGDLLIVYDGEKPSISEEYASILTTWKQGFPGG